MSRLTSLFPWLALLLFILGALASYATGQVAPLGLIFFVAGGLALAVYAWQRPQAIRQFMGGRVLRYGLGHALTTVLFTGIVILLYWITAANPTWRYDVTANREYTPLPEMVALLAQAPTPVEALAFYSTTSYGRAEAQLYLDALTAASPNFSYRMVDPNISRTEALAYNVTDDGVVVFITHQGQADERTADLFFLNDRDVYAALLQLINPTPKKAYFITGHGEPALDDAADFGLSEAILQLQDLGFTTELLDLRTAAGVPADAGVVALITPQVPLAPEEVQALDTYSAAGGALFIVRDVIPTPEALRAEQDGLAPYLQTAWGLALRPDIVIDPAFTYFDQVFTFVIQDFGFSPIITPDVRQFALLLSAARSIAVTPLDAVEVTALLRTSDRAWGETNLDVFPPVQEDTDTAGPLGMAVSAENQTSGGRLVLVGDADFLVNKGIYNGGNSIFLTNAFNWLAGDEQTLTLTPRTTIERNLTLTETQLASLQVTSLCAAPLLILAFGLYNWRRRKANGRA